MQHGDSTSISESREKSASVELTSCNEASDTREDTVSQGRMAATAVASGGSGDAASGALTNTSKKESGFGGWLQRVRRTGQFSDVLVRINDTAEFRLHMLPLRNASAFFRDELGDGPSSPDAVVEIMDLPGGSDAFSIVADFCYLVKPLLTFDTVAGVRAAAEKLGMPDLLDTTKRFLYASVFSHWRSSVAFLERFKRVGSNVDEYVETRCLKVIATACTKAFSETKHVSVPIAPQAATTTTKAVVGASTAKGICWQSSPCHALTEIFVTVCSRLPDEYMSQLVDILVEAEVNLSVKCRQGRNVRAWLNHVLRDECRSDRGRCWILLCLSRMLLKSGGEGMELSSQYFCTLLEHVGQHVWRLRQQKLACWDAGTGGFATWEDTLVILGRLQHVKAHLEKRIGSSLHELDDYLHSYRFPPDTLLSLVRHFVAEEREAQQLEEVATEIDGCLWAFAECQGSITADEFVSIFSAFPSSSRSCHDTLYASIERMLSNNNNKDNNNNNSSDRSNNSGNSSKAMSSFDPDEVQSLWALVDCDKLSTGVHEQALNNPAFLCQPHVLERVLRMHNEELSDDNSSSTVQRSNSSSRKELRNIMQKVIKASLKLLEENSRRSKEIVELQRQYAALLGSGGGGAAGSAACFSSSCEDSPDALPFHRSKSNRVVVHPDGRPVNGNKSSGTGSDDDMTNTVGSVMVAPQTPMVEARRSLHAVSAVEMLA